MHLWGVQSPEGLVEWMSKEGLPAATSGVCLATSARCYILVSAMESHATVQSLNVILQTVALHLCRPPEILFNELANAQTQRNAFRRAPTEGGSGSQRSRHRAEQGREPEHAHTHDDTPGGVVTPPFVPFLERPEIPAAKPDRSSDSGWPALDHVPIPACATSPFAHLREVPEAHAEGWASAVADVMRYVEEASSEDELVRGLKRMLVLHEVLLRFPPRGGRQGHAHVAHRFDAWVRGDFEQLVRWWETDRSATHHPLRSGTRSEEQNIERALRLISEGQISRACKLLVSKGLADPLEMGVLAQLREKHPNRKEDMPGTLPEDARPPASAFEGLDLGAIRSSDSYADVGISDFRNNHLKLLLREFPDEHCRSALPLLNRFARRYVQAELPLWFYLVFSQVKLVAPQKGNATSTGQPDVRPIGIGECLCRVIHRTIITERKESMASYFWPQQVAIGVPNGISLLLFGVRTLLEMRPDWVILKIDLRNAYNEIKRACILRRLIAVDVLHDLVPLFWASYGPAADVFLSAPGMPLAPFASSEGVQRGDAIASACFCAGIQPDVIALDNAVASHGGVARFDMNDGYMVGPASVVFEAVLAFTEAIRALGSEVRLDKCFCYSPHGGLEGCQHRPADFPVGSEKFPDGSKGFGVMVSGVPVGDAACIKGKLTLKVSEATSKVTTVNSKLRDAHIQSLFAVLRFALAPLLDYWLQHCYPEDVRQAVLPFQLADTGWAYAAGRTLPHQPSLAHCAR